MDKELAAGVLGKRRSGVLLHITSLPSRYGAGDLGHAAYRFVEFLQRCGFGIWQVLPLGPTHRDLSPYDALSAHAGNPQLISLDWLHDRGWLSTATLAQVAGGQSSRQVALAEAGQCFHDRLAHDAQLVAEYAAFCRDDADWLDDYAHYTALREEHDGEAWYRWPSPFREREPVAMAQVAGRLAVRLEGLRFEQFVFFRQWNELRAYAHRHGVYLFGDLPIFVAQDSADTWSHRDLFRLGADGLPLVEAGVPPDFFSAEGQRWGNPHYAWEEMARDGFDWWRHRLATQLEFFDLIRIDHFRGFEACWEIPRTALSAAEGHWVPAPGDALLQALRDRGGEGVLVAENLGIITPEVEALRRRHGLPGMLVMHFGFDGDPLNLHLPHNHEPWNVVYSGTHDNDTSLGWFDALPDASRTQVLDYLGVPGEPMPWPLLRATLASVARLAIIPLQDLLGLGGEHRMNRPGIAAGNWRWQFEESQLDAELILRLAHLNRCYGRTA